MRLLKLPSQVMNNVLSPFIQHLLMIHNILMSKLPAFMILKPLLQSLGLNGVPLKISSTASNTLVVFVFFWLWRPTMSRLKNEKLTVTVEGADCFLITGACIGGQCRTLLTGDGQMPDNSLASHSSHRQAVVEWIKVNLVARRFLVCSRIMEVRRKKGEDQENRATPRDSSPPNPHQSFIQGLIYASFTHVLDSFLMHLPLIFSQSVGRPQVTYKDQKNPEIDMIYLKKWVSKIRGKRDSLPKILVVQ